MNDEFLNVVASTLPLFTYDQTTMCSCQAFIRMSLGHEQVEILHA